MALGMAALGLTISLVVGEFDMSVGSMVSIGSMVSMMMIAGDKPIIVAVLLTVLIGALGGVVNGFIRTVLRIPGVIPTIGTQSVFAGIALLINSGNMVYGKLYYLYAPWERICDRISHCSYYISAGGGDGLVLCN